MRRTRIRLDPKFAPAPTRSQRIAGQSSRTARSWPRDENFWKLNSASTLKTPCAATQSPPSRAESEQGAEEG